MSKKDKSQLIKDIFLTLKAEAFARKGHSFCEGDTIFSLAFKSDKELIKIARLCGVAI